MKYLWRFTKFSLVVILGATLAWLVLQKYEARKILARVSSGRYEDRAKAAGVPIDVYRSVGWYGSHPQMGHRKYSIAKPKGVIRIGIFGSSSTQGDEAGKGLDFPSQLESILHSRGFTNVQVLNFGMGGFGLHQVYRLWEIYAKNFDLDLAVLGPNGYRMDWSDSFSRPPAGLHGRYVLEGDGIRFIEPPTGETFREAYEKYLSLPPKPGWAIYDRNFPIFAWKFRAGWNMEINPFYYTHLNRIEEQKMIYDRILNRWSREIGAFVAFATSQTIAYLGGVEIPSGVMTIPLATQFPFWREAHPAATAYRSLALTLADAITKRQTAQNYFINIDHSGLLETGDPSKLRSLENFDKVEVYLDKILAGQLEPATHLKPEAERGTATNPHSEKISAVLGVRGSTMNSFDPWFQSIPLAELKQDLTPRWVWREGSTLREVPLPKLRFVSAETPIAFLDLSNAYRSYDLEVGNGSLFCKKSCLPNVKSENAEIYLGKRLLYKVTTHESGNLKLIPNEGGFLTFRPGSKDLIPIENIRSKGSVRLLLHGEQTQSFLVNQWQVKNSPALYDPLRMWKALAASQTASKLEAH